MHEAALSQAAMPQTPSLFRVKLRPYSIGHELHLFRRSSPLLTKPYSELAAMPRTELLPRLMQAVEVCSRDYVDNFNTPRNWGLWRSYCEWCNLAKALDTLWAYLQEAHQAFKAELPDGEGYTTRFIGAPEILRLYQFVCNNVPDYEIRFYSTGKRLTAWDFPFSLASMMKQAADEAAGNLSIWNFRHEAEQNYIKENPITDEWVKAQEKEHAKRQCQTQ